MFASNRFCQLPLNSGQKRVLSHALVLASQRDCLRFQDMRDAITGLIGRYDQLGRYLDRTAIDSIETYLDESSLRIEAVELINREAAEIQCPRGKPASVPR